MTNKQQMGGIQIPEYLEQITNPATSHILEVSIFK